ncbi:MAG: archaetidylserine decarboxylase [Pseudohongiellaceae bacterium]
MASLFIWFQYLVPQHLLSRLVGWLANSRRLRVPFIRWFVKRYRVDLSEATVQEYGDFASFNDFFTRELKPEARPLAEQAGAVLCPADGCISQLGTINDALMLQAKGRYFSVDELLGVSTNADMSGLYHGDVATMQLNRVAEAQHGTDVAALYRNGSFATIYLAPRDYHRVHLPLAGRLLRTRYIPGKLFSVNKVTTERVPNLFARNERLVCEFITDSGPMALIMVGAMIVAGIETVWGGRAMPGKFRVDDYQQTSPPIELARGAEVGRFLLGSTVIVLFPHGSVKLNSELTADCPVLMGQQMGQQMEQQPGQ